MEQLKGFPEDFSRSLESCFVFLKKYNVRFLVEDLPFWKKYWRFSYITIISLINFVTVTVHFAARVIEGETIEVANTMPKVLVFVHVIIKSFLMIPKVPEISKIIRDIGTLWRTEFTEKQTEKKNKILSAMIFWNAVLYYFVWIASWLCLTCPILEALVRRFIMGQDFQLMLPLAATFPFNPTENWVIYMATYCFQIYALIYVVSAYNGFEMVLITLCTLISTEFIMLQEDLRNTDESCEEGNDLKMFVRKHQKLIQLSQQLNEIFHFMIFIFLIFVGMTSCTFIFAGKFNTGLWACYNYVAVLTSISPILYLCKIGELLIDASGDIGDVAYETKWYKGSRQFKRAILLIIMISQKPCRLTSMKYAVVDLTMFTKVMSTTWSYFSLMTMVYTDENI